MSWPAFRNRRENPYNWLLYTELSTLGVEVSEFSVRRLLFGPRADILHMHWAPTSRIRGDSRRRVIGTSRDLMLILTAARLRKMKVVWTAHNLGDHDRTAHDELEGPYWSRVARHLDALISLSAPALETLRRRYPALRTVPAFITKHGHYRNAYPRNLGRDEARRILGIAPDARVISFVGQIRPYKNLPALLRAFRKLEDTNAVLLVAGKLKLGDSTDAFDELVTADSRVRVFGGLIREEEMQHYLGAADLVVLPYREILNSGSAILALSFDRPVLLPAGGSMTELARDTGDDWVLTYDGELTSETLSKALEAARLKQGQTAPLAHLDWRRIAEQTRDIYRSLIS